MASDVDLIEIGGHKMRPDNAVPGMLVFRDTKAENIIKRGYGPADIEGVHTEAKMLRLMEDTGFTPKLYEEHDDYIVQEDLGEQEEMKEVHDGELFRRESARFLMILREKRIRHGDLTGANLFIRNDRPIFIDWQQSSLFDEDDPYEKRSLTDSYFFWRTIQSFPSKLHPTPDTPRVIRRWMACLGSMGGFGKKKSMPEGNVVGKTLLDLGCFQGDFSALAAAEGMIPTGVDMGGFRTGEDSIAIAIETWKGKAGAFNKINIMDWKDFEYDAVLMFSTWAYIYNEYGQDTAYGLISRIMDQCGVLFFETQLAGDGPGQDYLVTDDDVGNMLGQFGIPNPIGTFHVAGRPANRTVWQVKPK